MQATVPSAPLAHDPGSRFRSPKCQPPCAAPRVSSPSACLASPEMGGAARVLRDAAGLLEGSPSTGGFRNTGAFGESMAGFARLWPPRAGSVSALAATLCLLLVSGSVTAAEIPATGARVTRVTVYADRAEAVRQATVQVPAGASVISFAGIPWGTEPDSLRVSARGVPATIGAVELTQEAKEPPETPELIAARQEVERIEAAIAGLDAEEATSNELREFVRALKATTAKRESEKLGEGTADPNSIHAVYDLVKGSLAELSKGTIDRQERRKKLAKDLEVARARLAAARPSGPIRYRIATVEVQAERAGSLTLDLMYVAAGALWRPAYRAVLDAATGEVSLTSEAVVRQSTGEDWSGVALSLSTASPARGVQPPVLPPWLLRPLEVIAYNERLGARVMSKAQAAPAPGQMESLDAIKEDASAEYGAAEGGFVDIEAEQASASIVHSAYNVAFEVPGTSDVPADGRDHRVGLRQESLEGSVRYRAVPALNEAAFLVSKTKAPTGYPLLSGPVRVFAGGAFIGSFPIAETGPGAEVTLPFGIDNRVKVKRTLLPESRDQRGIVGKDRVVTQAFRTTIENLRDQPVQVTLEDRVPVSEDGRIRVEVNEETTPGSREIKERPGVLEWDLELKPGEKRDVVLSYTVRFPADLVVPGF